MIIHKIFIINNYMFLIISVFICNFNILIPPINTPLYRSFTSPLLGIFLCYLIKRSHNIFSISYNMDKFRIFYIFFNILDMMKMNWRFFKPDIFSFFNSYFIKNINKFIYHIFIKQVKYTHLFYIFFLIN